MTTVKQVVKEFNDKLFNSSLHDQDYFWYLEYTETPIGDFIKYYGQIIWDSENDYRAELQDSDGGREDMKSYLVKEVGKISKILQNSYEIIGSKR